MEPLERTARLVDLLASLDAAEVSGSPNEIVVTGISNDTRRLRAGEVFLALPGDHTDGTLHVGDAVDRGASAVVLQGEAPPGLAVPAIRVPDARKALSRLSSAFWGHPSRELRIVGITGTDGKTTTTFLTSAVLEAGGFSTGFVTTVDLKIAGHRWRNPEHISTPQPPDLHMRLRQMVDAGVDYAVIESSSHGLKLNRLEDVAYDVAVLTNVTSEHLELHGSVEQYRRDKARLFSMLGESPDKGVSKIGVINADDPSADLFLKSTAGDTLTYGTARYADVVAERVQQSADGLRFTVRAPDGGVPVVLPMIGVFNVYNALAAICVGISQGLTLEACARALRSFPGVPGRMQVVNEGQPFGVMVDYAHTADSLAKVLHTLRPATRGRLVVVFGSAGERDATKRAPMGEVAARYADMAIFTNEDPRGEPEEAIIAQIAEGAEAAGASRGRDFLCIPNRRDAIYEGFRRAQPGDMILLAGKGHESTIEYKDGPVPWDEAGVARELLRLL